MNDVAVSEATEQSHHNKPLDPKTIGASADRLLRPAPSSDSAYCERHAVPSAIAIVATAVATAHSGTTVCDAPAGTTNRNASIGNAAAAPVTAPSLCVANLRESAERKCRECHCRQNELLHNQ